MKKEFKTCRGKTVKRVTAETVEPYCHSLMIEFTDETAMYFDLMPEVRLDPEHISLKGNCRAIRRYPVQLLTSGSERT
jgi:hypothetical protein